MTDIRKNEKKKNKNTKKIVMLLELIKIENVSLHTLNVSSKAAMLKSLTSLPMRWLRHLVVLRPIITTPQLSENLSRFFTSSEDYFWGTAFASFIQVKDFSYSIGILIQLFEDWLWGFWRFKLNLIPWFDFFLTHFKIDSLIVLWKCMSFYRFFWDTVS